MVAENVELGRCHADEVMNPGVPADDEGRAWRLGEKWKAESGNGREESRIKRQEFGVSRDELEIRRSH
jgi:hypothetical protein